MYRTYIAIYVMKIQFYLQVGTVQVRDKAEDIYYIDISQHKETMFS